MKPFIFSAVLIFVLFFEPKAQVKLPSLSSVKGGNLTQVEAGDGIKEALNQGVVNAVLNLGKTDGFFGSALYKMLLPPEFAKAEKVLRNAGLGKEVDKAILAMNRGAEEAVLLSKPIFVSAIKGMTLTDALTIVRGSDRAATDYFQKKTTDSLKVIFTPSVKTSLDKTEATKYYADIVNTYNKLPTSFKKLNPDLTSYVVEKSMAALFDQIAQQESLIRRDPAAQTSALLQKVFGKK
jgi:Protein of unknown function (DUF4197)